MLRFLRLVPLAVFALAAWGLTSLPSEDSSDHGGGINAVLGDVSFVLAHGRAPTPSDDETERVRTHLA